MPETRRRGRPRKPYVADARSLAMCELIRQGKTLQEIGNQYGVTRERVRQIVKNEGLSGTHGSAVRAMERRRNTRQISARELVTWRKWGMSLGAYTAFVAEHGNTATRASPMERFVQQRRSAHKRGIEWQMTFADWWRIWQESGHWSERGRGQGYCMARWGDSGPYSPENVYICTIGQNFSDSYLSTPASVRVAKRRQKILS